MPKTFYKKFTAFLFYSCYLLALKFIYTLLYKQSLIQGLFTVLYILIFISMFLMVLGEFEEQEILANFTEQWQRRISKAKVCICGAVCLLFIFNAVPEIQFRWKCNTLYENSTLITRSHECATWYEIFSDGNLRLPKEL